MMSYKKILVLTLFAASFQTTQTMGGTKHFAKKVLLSKTALVSAGAMGTAYALEWKSEKNLEKKLKDLDIDTQSIMSSIETPLPPKARKYLTNFFKNNDLPGQLVTIRSNGAGVNKFGNVLILHLSERELDALRSDFAGDMTEQQLSAVLGHEVEHVKKGHHEEKSLLKSSFALPIVVGSAEITHALRGNRVKTLGAAVVGAIAAYIGYMQHIQFREFDCDAHAAHNALRGQGIVNPTNEQLAQVMDALISDLENYANEEKEFSLIEKIQQQLWGTHPLTSKRIDDLRKAAQVLRSHRATSDPAA